MLCRFINPEVARRLFDENVIQRTDSTEDVMFDQMSKDLKGKYSADDLKRMMDDPKRYTELDRIEKVDQS